MARNKLSDLNNHFMAQLERLENEDLTPEQLDQEIKRSKAIESIGKQVISNARLCLDAAKAAGKGDISPGQTPQMIGSHD